MLGSIWKLFLSTDTSVKQEGLAERHLQDFSRSFIYWDSTRTPSKIVLVFAVFFFVLASRNSPIGTDSVEVGRRWVGRSSYSFAETVFVIWTNLTLFETCAIVRIPWVLARKRNSELLRSPHTLRFVSYPKVASKQQEPIIIHFWRRLI